MTSLIAASTWAGRAALASVVVVVLSACVGPALPVVPSDQGSTTPTARVTATNRPEPSAIEGSASPSIEPGPVGPTPPPGDPVRFDEVKLGPDRRAVTLEFVGGREYSAKDPCSRHYSGWAADRGDTLEVKIVDDTPAATRSNECDTIGFGRRLLIALDRPFTGTRVHDLAGYVHFLARPGGLAELAGLPAGWRMTSEGDVQDSPTGRWRRSWTIGTPPPLPSPVGKVDLYQSFDGPVEVTGGEEITYPDVNGAPATLYRFAPSGELVLVWQLGNDGLALVVSEQDFPMNAAITLAGSARLP